MTLPAGTVSSRAKANTTARQKLKSKWDKRCKYDADAPLVNEQLDGHYYEADVSKTGEENWCRLLDEGVVVDNSYWTGEPYAYACIKKGVIKKWYETLPDNFVGTIDKDHNRSIDLGKFTKKDLRLVETSEGRYAVDVNVKLDHELYAVKDLLRMNNRTALSVEMFINADEYATADKVTGDKDEGKYLVPLIDELKIEGYAVCLAPKSANSYKDGLLKDAGATNTNLNEDFSTMDKEELRKLAAEGDAEAKAKLAELEAEDASAGAPEDELVNKDAAETDTDGDANAETGDGEAPEGEGEGEETTDDDNADEGDGESEGDENADADTETAEEKLSAIETKMQEFATEKKQLMADLEAKDKEIANLKEQLSAQTKKEESFETRLTNILSLAASDEKTDGEGGDATSEKQEDATVDMYQAAFNEMETE